MIDRRPLWLAWTRVDGRGRDMAVALGGEAVAIHIPSLSGSPVRDAIRYVVSSLLTAVAIVKRRPSTVIVTNPPVVAPLAALVAIWLVRGSLVLDSHPGGFGLQGDQLSGRLQWLHRWLIRRASAVLVTTTSLAEHVEELGGRPIVVHEPPPAASPAPLPARSAERPRVLFATIFARDEPVDVVLGAAALLADCDVVATGDPSRLPADAAVPPHLVLAGWLAYDAYLDLLASVDVVVVITDEPESVPRAACEAAFMNVPLVVSDEAATRAYFDGAEFARNTAEEIAGAVRRVLGMPADQRVARSARLHDVVMSRWLGQLDDLQAVLDVR